MKLRCCSTAAPSRLLPCLLVLASSLIPQTAPASGVVTNCTDADLRAALADGGTVLFACDGTIVLTNTLTIATNTILDVSGRQIILSGGGAVRPFVVNSGVQFTLKNVTVADGLGTNGGGAMANGGLTRLIDCTFSNNTVISSFAGVPAFGGAVHHSAGSLDISACAFLFNRIADTNFPGAPGFGSGGAIANTSFNTTPTGPLNVTNCTFLGNSAWTWGAIAMPPRPGANGPANLVNSTFVGNSNGAVSYVQGLTWVTNRLVAMNCIFASNNGPNCSGVTDGGFNISSDSSGGFTNSFSLQNVDPRLGPLANNGGPTLTLAPLPDSPAIDSGSTMFIPATDQRGVSRPFGAASDVGAYEFTATGTSAGSFYVFATTNFVSEAGGSVAFTVIRAGETAGQAAVNFATGNGTATEGSDFTAANGVLLFGAGLQSNTVHVAVLEDSAVEGNENFTLTLSNPTGGASIGRAAASVTISDNDSAFLFSSANYSADEGTGSNVIKVVRAGTALGSASVSFAALPGTALSGGDFFPTNGVLVFASGQTSATFTVRFVNDVAPEPAKTVTLQLSSPTGGPGLGEPATATLTITDNDPVQPGAVQLSLAAHSVSEGSGEVELAVVRTGGTNGVVSAQFTTSSGTASAGSDFTPTNGTVVFGDTETRKSIRVAITPDAMAEGAESFNVTLSNPAGGATLGNLTAALVTILDGTQTLTTCDEAGLRAAVNAGGHVVLACDGTILLTSPLQVNGGVSLDASGHSVNISGGNATRLFVIQPGVTLTLRGLSLVDGLARGTNGNPGQSGGSAQGGAICNSNGVVNAYDCVFLRHRAQGGAGGGGIFPSIGSGGPASGGALFNWLGWVNTSNCVFAGNRADGGKTGGIGTDSIPGGEARGGAICNLSGVMNMVDTLLSSNVAQAGPGNRHGHAPAFGGSVFNMGSAALVRSSLQGNFAIADARIEAGGGALSHHGLGILSLTDCTVTDNRALGGQGLGIGTPFGVPGRAGQGGGLYIAAGEARLTNTTLAHNWAVGGAGVPSGAGAGQGGGLYTTGAVLLVNCTVAANTALGGRGYGGRSDGEGGGLYNAAGGLSTLIHTTVALNSASGVDGRSVGGAIATAGGVVSLRSTILANSLSGSNCYGSGFVDEGHNLSSDASCPFTAPGSLINVDPRLGPLADYGGPTPTMALLAGSPAVDSADPAFCPSTDQRGRARPFGAGCDIGAFESAPPYTILGYVHGFNAPASGIQINAPATSTSVPPGGQFALHGFAVGTYLLSIASPECVFVPRTRSVMVGPDIVDVSFFSYRSNALVIERLSASAVRCVFAGEDGATYHVLSGTNLPVLTPYSTNQAQSNGLFEFTESTAGSPKRFFQVVRP